MEISGGTPTKQIFDLGGGDGLFGRHGGCNDLFTILLLFFLFAGGGFGGFGRGPMPPPPMDNGASAIAASQISEMSAAMKYGANAHDVQTGLLNSLITGQAVNTANVTAAITNNAGILNQNLQNGFYNLNTTALNNKFDTVTAMNACCCETQRGILDLKAEMDKIGATIITASKDNTQAILNALCSHWEQEYQTKIGDLQRQLSESNIIGALKNA